MDKGLLTGLIPIDLKNASTGLISIDLKNAFGTAMLKTQEMWCYRKGTIMV